MLEKMQYRLSEQAEAAMREYIALRLAQPHFANARSIRNALDRARLRLANRLFSEMANGLGKNALMTLEAADIRASRVFQEATEQQK